MAHCPHCESEITELRYSRLRREYGRCYLEDSEYLSHEGDGDDAPEDGDDELFYCPECNERIHMSYNEALAFLNGGTTEANGGGAWSTNQNGVPITGGNTWTTSP